MSEWNSTWDNSPGIRGLAIDLDGVLVDSYRIWFQVLNATLREFGRPILSEESFRTHWGQPIEQDLDIWFPNRSVEEVSLVYERHFPDHSDQVRILPGARELLEGVQDAEVCRCVITNSPRKMAEILLRAGDLRSFFEEVFTADDVPRSKPHPDLVLAGAEAMGLAPAATLVIGDSRFDAMAADAAGAPFLLFQSHEQVAACLHEGGVLP